MTPPMHSLCPCLLSACLSAHHKRAHTKSRRVTFNQARPAKLALLISLRLPDPPIELLGSTLYSHSQTSNSKEPAPGEVGEPYEAECHFFLPCSDLLLSARIESTGCLARHVTITPTTSYLPHTGYPSVSQVNYPRVCVCRFYPFFRHVCVRCVSRIESLNLSYILHTSTPPSCNLLTTTVLI